MNRKEKVAEFEQGYNVMVTGRHVHVTQGMKDHAVERISKLEHFGNKISDVTVTMDIQKLEHRVDILMKYGHTIIRAHAASEDMYASIDKAVHKLETQLKKYKQRLQEHYLKGHPIQEVLVEVYSQEQEEMYPIETLPPQHRIVSSETRPLKILSNEEAIMKMDLSLDPLMVFRSEKDRLIKVIYRREDGNYGIIAPE